MEDGASYRDIFIHEGQTFVSSTFLDRIPTDPPDPPVRDKLFGDNLGSENSAFVVLRRGGRLFVPLKFLNKLLSSAARPLRIDIATNTDADGDLQFTLGLRDLGGAPVEMAAPGPALQRGLQQSANSGQGGAPGDGGRGLRERSQERRPAAVTSAGSQTPQSSGSALAVEVDLEQDFRASSKSLQNRVVESQPTASSSLAQVRQSSTQPDSGQQPLGSERIDKDSGAQSSNIKRVSPQNDNINTPDVGVRPETTISSAHLRSRLVHGMKTWEQLREMRITDADVSQDFLGELYPKALRTLLGAPNTNHLVPLFKLPNGERYMIKISTGIIWAPQTLLTSGKLTVNAVCELELRSKIQELFTTLREIQKFRRNHGIGDDEYSIQPCLRKGRKDIRAWSSTLSPTYLEAVLSDPSSQKYENMLHCKDEINRYIEQSLCCLDTSNWRPEWNSGTPNTRREYRSTAKIAETLTGIIYDQFSFYNDLMTKKFLIHGSYTRLIRELKLEAEVTLPPQRQCALPMYVLPLGRLCRMGNTTDMQTAIDLEEVVLMDVLSPSKTIWRYRLPDLCEEWPLGPCSLIALGSIHEIGHINDMVDNHGGLESFHGDLWSIVPTINHPSEKHPDSRIDTDFGHMWFDRSLKNDLLTAIEATCGTQQSSGDEEDTQDSTTDEDDDGAYQGRSIRHPDREFKPRAAKRRRVYYDGP